MSDLQPLRPGALAIVATTFAFFSAGFLPALDLVRLDVCERVSGAEVARLVGGSLEQARGFNDPEGDLARCTYFVDIARAGKTERVVFSLEVTAVEDFVEVRPYVEAPIHEVADLGDGAWAFRDPDSMDRVRLYVLRRGVATLDVTGEDEAEVRKVAELAVAKF